MLPSRANVQLSATHFAAPGSQYTSQPPPSAFMPLPELHNKTEEATPIRPPASAHLMIDSLDRYPTQFAGFQQQSVALSQPGNNFKIESQEALIYGYFTRLGITQAYLKYNVPTVVDASANFSDTSGAVIGNNRFSIQQVAGAVLTVNIPQGFYTPQTLADAVNVQLAASPAPYNTYTMAWNNATNSLRIASNNGQNFFVSPTIFNAATDPGTSVVLRCKYLLGISASNIGPANARQVQFFGPPRMYYTSFVDIVSQRLTKYQRVKDSESGSGINRRQTQTTPAIQNIVARVFLTPPNQRTYDISGGLGPGSAPVDIVVDYNTPKHIRWSGEETVYELDFQLYDQFGQPLFWTPKFATEFCLTMVASET